MSAIAQIIKPWGGVQLYSLINSQGTQVDISDLGATIVNFWVKDKNDQPINIVLGYDEPEEYLDSNVYFGAVVGPWANRIAAGQFELQGTLLQLDKNEGDNHLHGGSCQLHKKVWSLVQCSSTDVIFSIKVKQGEAGYPANIDIQVHYSLTDENELVIEYKASPDNATPLNLTQHSYFNLSHQPDILEHSIQINSKEYWHIDESSIPKTLSSVAHSPMDLRESVLLHRYLKQKPDYLTNTQGFDHCWVLNADIHEVCAYVSCVETGLTLSMYTDQPGVQFYSGNFLKGTPARDGRDCHQHAGLCLEAQLFPNQVNMPEYKDGCIFDKNKVYQQKTIYKVGLL